jgi:hypothetical protein
MRWLLTLSVMVVGCTDGVAPPILTGDDAGVGDMNDEDMSVDAGEDLLNVDLTPQMCRTACDCPNGQACINNVCSTGVQVFCCGTAACTGADTCQFSDGRFSQCAAPQDGGIRDAGMASSCMSTPCTPGLGSQLFCSLAWGTLTAMCSGATGHCTP